MIIDLDSQQSKIWQERKELVIIEPMEIQPEKCDRCNGYGYKTGNSVDDIYYASGKIQCYKCDGMGIKYKDCPVKVGDGININYKIDYVYNHITGNKIVNSTITEKAKVIEILEPKRVQDIELYILEEAFQHKFRESNLNLHAVEYYRRFKNWFNRKFAEPKPVECRTCKNTGMIYPEDITCQDCNGDGIEKYIYYSYDEDINRLFYDGRFEKYQKYGGPIDWWKNKLLEIIVNPWNNIYKIGAINE